MHKSNWTKLAKPVVAYLATYNSMKQSYPSQVKVKDISGKYIAAKLLDLTRVEAAGMNTEHISVI